MTDPQPHTARAFTLVEMLVVIAVIALLISILLPTLAGAREQARSGRCLANLKDLGSAAYTYAAGDSGNYLVPIHWRAVGPVFGAQGVAPRGAGGAYLQGDIQWGGTGGDPRLFNDESGLIYGNRWAFTHAYQYGPADRPLNKVIYKNLNNAHWPSYISHNVGPDLDANDTDANLPAAIADSRRDLPVFHCPSDTGWESGRGGEYYVNVGYVVKPRGFDLGVPHYELTGNSYKHAMNWLQAGSRFYSTTVWGTPADRIHNPSSLVMWTEANAEDTAFWNRPEMETSAAGLRADVAGWWVQGWHQRDGQIMVFNTSFADGHAGKLDQRVRSAYTNYEPSGDGSEFYSGTPGYRGSRPDPVNIPFGWGTSAEENLGWWGDKLYRGDGWAIDNLPAPPQYVMPIAG